MRRSAAWLLVTHGAYLKLDAIACGGEYSCGLTASGEVVYWGDNTFGQVRSGGFYANGCAVSRLFFGILEEKKRAAIRAGPGFRQWHREAHVLG